MAPRRKSEPAITQRASTPLEMETEAGDDLVTVLLDGVPVRVRPVRQWRSSGLRALREGDFQTWAEKCLDPASVDTWEDIDPTIADVETFFGAWAEATGQSVGKSPASPRSSMSTRTR